jgi:serine/threonine protein phosphatase 1
MSPAEQARKASVPPGSLVYAIGDIHGRLDLLDALLAMIVADAQGVEATERLLVFLGDYIDRGPDSAGVIDRLISGLPEGFASICLKGNHEAIMLDFLERPAQLNLWVENGAAATLASYGLDAYGFDWHWGDEAGCRDDLVAAMPANHRSFLEELRLSYQCGDYFFAHAGVRPGVPLDAQRPQDLIWIRAPFLESDADFGKVVVHGHTPGERPVVRPNRIGIDTAAWLRGTLTALRLEGTDRAFLATPAG